MHQRDADRLLSLIQAERDQVMALEDVTTHFLAGAFYALDRAESIIRRANVEAPTCLIHCRQESKEE